MPVNYIIIVAGGSGSRMKQELPKQFIPIHNTEIFLYSVFKFRRFDPQIKIIIAAHKNFLEHVKLTLQRYELRNAEVTEGGETRFQSVKNALALVNDPDAVVGVHDAARPLVSMATIERCYHAARETGNATPAITVNETLRVCNANNSEMVNRDDYRLIQTPQCFIAGKIIKAFEQPYSPAFTDDASVLEAAGEKINLVEGNIENIKITHPRDLIIAKALLEDEQR